LSPNQKAFLDVIATCEGAGYTTLYGGGTFEGFDDHPRKAVTAGRWTSTAAGRYQILSRTWDDFCRFAGPLDFSPDSQDACALWLIDRRGAGPDVEAGRLEDAVAKCNREWASLPGSPYGQPTHSLDFCRQVFDAARNAT
jgi:lysozyme